MLKENEVVMLILGIAVFFLILMNLEHIRKIKSWKLLISGFYLLLLGWLFTILEGYFLEVFLNFCEHISYAVSAMFITLWCLKFSSKVKEEETV